MSDKNYKTGYKKPPKSGQFQPGKSGNPKGRPRKTKNLATDLQEELSAKITVVEGNKEQLISKQRALIKALSTKALKGDIRAMNTLIRMIERTTPVELEDIVDKPLSTSDEALMKDFLSRNGIKEGGSDE
ncbi:MAG: DUF5681 domain-containing protein [Cycloclasticus sp.]|jgi:hypothetical protein|nr:DUF5681 domain-containing protein [Cycloclasticus sp.]